MDQINWKVRTLDTARAQTLAGALGIRPVTAALLLQRGCQNEEQCSRFLSPRLQDLTPPLLIGGIKEAVDIIRRAIDRQKTITIYGDYDVDGICSTVILQECLQLLGAKVDYYIPDRFKEGYGLNMDAVNRLGAAGCGLLITVDCGIGSVREIAAARDMGIEVIVTDHHTPKGDLPDANAIINPKLGHIESCRELCGAGVAYQLASSLFAPADDRTMWLDLVALATIADVVSLTGDNRILVKEGLFCMNKTQRPGLSHLMETCGIDLCQEVIPRQVGFLIAPRLNAAGRISHARLSVELLCTKTPDEAHYLADALNRLNDERKRTEEVILGEALLRVSHQPQLLENRILVLDGQQWHNGVLGIVASRLCEQYCKPVILINWDDDKEGRGSCRSVEGFDIHAGLEACSNSLLRFGGHPLAAGLTVAKEQLPALITDLEQWSRQHYPDQAMQKHRFVDLELDPAEIDSHLLEELKRLAPFGEGNPIPVLAVRAVELQRTAMVGQTGQHFKAQLSGPGLDMIAFSKPQYAQFNARRYKADIAFNLASNQFMGRENLQLRVKAMKPAYQPDLGTDVTMPWLHAAVSCLNKQEPVFFLAPTYRVLVKMKEALKQWFCTDALYSMHGHMSANQRLRVEQACVAKNVALYIVTKAYQNYLSRCKGTIGAGIHIIDLYSGWSELASAGDGAGNVANDWFRQWHQARPEEISPQGRHIVYANRICTIKAFQQRANPVFSEVGLTNAQQRRLVRRRFAEASPGILLTDGYASLEPPGEVDGVWLADLPFSAVEARQILEGLKTVPAQAVGCLFDQEGVDYNRDYLKRLYPDTQRIKRIFEGLCALGTGALEGEIAVLCQRLSRLLDMNLSSLDLLPVLHILADLGLCQIKKKGSIMAIMLLSCTQKSVDTADSPYYLEGLESKKVFHTWVKGLQQIQLW